MKVDIGDCTTCGARNSKFVEKCYKCQALLPWAPGYQPPAPQAPAPAPRPAYAPAPPAPAPLPAAPAYTPPAYTPPAYEPPAAPAPYPQPLPIPQPLQIPQPQNQNGYAPAYPQAQGMPTRMPMGPMICPQCGYSGFAQSFMEGSTWIGVVLCLVWLVPGILYFIWQSSTRYQGCPQCRSRTLFPLHSHEGQFAASRFYSL